LAFFLLGDYLLQFLGLEQEAVSIAGGVVLFSSLCG
jgi:small neutral amino acid transporter SnatA (MarC family)